MGRQTVTGLPLLCALMLVAAAGACDRDRPPSESGALFRPSGEAQSRDLGIYADQRRVGDFHWSRQPGRWGDQPATGYTESVTIRLSFGGDAFTVRSRQAAYVTPDLVLLGSESAIGFGAGRWEVSARRNPDGSYTRVERTGGASRTGTLRIPDQVLPAEVLPVLLDRFEGPDGSSRQYRVHNMTLDQTLPVRITFHGRFQQHRRFTLVYWGMEEEIWLDDDGMIVGESMALGVAARPAVEGEVAGSLALEKLLTGTSIPARALPADIADRDEALYRVEGVFAAPPDTPWQTTRKTGDRTEVRVVRPRVPGVEERRLLRADLDTLGLDLENSRIRDLAAEITAGLEDPWDKATAVNRWVFTNLRKTMRECFTATDALAAGEGECQTHSLLAVSLLTSSGVPARFAYGVVSLPGKRDALFFHTWVEVGIGQWIPLDPTLGAAPAGVDHITLRSGNYRDQFQLFPYILNETGWRVVYVDK